MLPLSPLLETQRLKRQSDLAAQEPSAVNLSLEDGVALALSDFVSESLALQPDWLKELHQVPPQGDDAQRYREWLEEAMADAVDEVSLMRALRLFRRRMLTRISWAQSLSLCTTQQTLAQLSELAEVLIVSARDWLYEQCCREWGTPVNSEGEAQPLLILGMGKLGGGELNFSSDIDLIFAYPENGETQGGDASSTTHSSLLALGSA